MCHVAAEAQYQSSEFKSPSGVGHTHDSSESISFSVHRSFHPLEIVLLRPNHASWSADAHPADDLGCRKAIVLHDVAPNARTSPAQPRLAAHSRCTACDQVCKQFQPIMLVLSKGPRESIAPTPAPFRNARPRILWTPDRGTMNGTLITSTVRPSKFGFFELLLKS